MSSVDERIVQMRFDNKQFESGVSESVKSLDNLKKGLNLEGASKGLSDLERAGRSFSLAGIASGVDAIASKFTTLGIIGVTALQNITNSAINAGKRMISSLTVDPIKMGFQEYETKMGAIQTILTNTQGGQKKITQGGVSSAKETSAASVEAIQETNDAAMNSLRKTQNQELKDFQKLADTELNVLEDKYDSESEALNKAQDQELKEYQKLANQEIDTLDDKYDKESESLRNSQDQQLKDYEKLADNELKVLEDKHDKASDALEKAIEDENRNLKKAHQEKLDLYDEEYMQKLKVVDEGRYNQIKAIDNEIKAIKNLTKTEDEQRAKKEQDEKLLELQNNVRSASNEKDRIEAAKRLSDFIDSINRKQLLKERNDKIESLNDSKKVVEDQYDLIKTNLKAEYKDKKDKENDLYETTLSTVKDQQEERRKGLRDFYQTEKDLMTERHTLERDALKEEQREKTEALKTTYDKEKELIKDRQDTEKENIKEQQDEKVKALKKTYQTEKDLIKERQEAEKDALKEKQDNESDALSRSNRASLKSAQGKNGGSSSGGFDTGELTEASTLEDVTKALDDLNEYSDKTIYNFAEMARNIGTFTAAGVDLKTSVTSIKGIANLAAGSGSTSQQASTAMYQLSQAIAAGSVKLQDWNSVVNAGMGGQLFQRALEKTAEELGHGRDMSVSFRESLQDGWITTEVLTKTLEKFANDESLIKAATQVKTFTQLVDTMRESVQSGWGKSWEYIIGDKDEATAVFTAVNDAFGGMINESADARNAMLKFWNDNGGRDAIIQAITNAFTSLNNVLKPIKEAFREVFPPTTGETLVTISKAIRDLTEHFKIGDQAASNIKITFKGLFSVIDLGLKGVKVLAYGMGELIKKLNPGSVGLLDMTASIGKFLTSLNDAVNVNDLMNISLEKMEVAFTVIKDIINKTLPYLEPVITSVKSALVKLGETFGSLFKGTTVFAAELTDTDGTLELVETKTNKLRVAIDLVREAFSKIGSVMSTVATTAKNILGPILTSVREKLDSLSMADVGALLTGGGFLMFARTLSKGLASTDKILKSFSGVLDQVGNTLKAFQLKVKADALLKIAIALAILAAALIALSFIDLEDLAKSLGILTVVFAELIGGLIIVNKYVKDVQKVTTQMVALGLGMLLLAYSVKTLSSIDRDKLIQGTAAIAALMGVIALFIKITKGGDLAASAGGLIGFAIGITILTGALAILGKMDPKTLEQGGLAIASIMGVIMLFINLTRGGDLAASAGGLIGFALGITILTGALAILGKMDPKTLEQGGIAIASIMGAIMLFINLTRGGDLATSAGGLMAFSIGIMILTGALAILGKMDVNKLEQGGVAISSLMVVIATFITLTKGGDLAASAGGLIGFAIGITILTGALVKLGNMDTDKVIQGGLAIAAIISSIALFVKLTKGGDLAASSAGLIGFAIGLTALSGAVAILAAIDPKRIEQGVISLIVLMTAIGTFITLTKEGDLAKSAGGLIGFSTGLMILAGVIAILSALNTEKLMMASAAISTLMVAIALFINLTKEGDLLGSSAGLVAFSIGIGLLATSLVVIAQLDTDKIISAGGAISVLLLSIVAFVNLTKGADLLVSAAGLVVFSGAIMVLTTAITNLGSADIKTLAIGVGALAAILVVLGLTSSILAPLTPVMLALSAAILLFGAGCLAVGAGMLAFSIGLANLSESGIKGADALKIALTRIIETIPLALRTLAKGILEFVKTIGDGAPVIAKAFMQVMTAIIDTIQTMTPKILDCASTLMKSFLKFLVDTVPDMVDSGMKLILGILKGISDHIQEVTEAGIDIIVNFIKGVTSKLPDIIDTAFKLIITFINGLADAIRENDDDIFYAVSNLIDAIIGAFKNLMYKFGEVGMNIVDGMVEGLKSRVKNLAKSAADLAESALDSAKEALGINSPSKAFAEVGKYSVQGFVNGLNKFSGLASDEAGNVGLSAMDSLRNAVGNIADLVSGNMDMNPTIRPVLDLGSVTSGIGTMDSLFNASRGITVDGIVDKTSSISGRLRANMLDSQNGSMTPSALNEIINEKMKTINVTVVSQLDGREIARVTAPAMSEELYNITRRRSLIGG